MEFEELEKQRGESIAAAARAALPLSGGMTLRERFQRVMHYQNVDKLPNFEFGYWSSTLSDWHKQGLPEEITDQKKAYEYFGIEDFHYAPVNTGLKINWFGKTVEETAEKRVYYDIYGALCEINTQGTQSIPRFLQFPVRDRKSWLEYRQERLLDDADRYPKNWDEFAKKSRNRDYPLGIGIGSMIGVPRNLIGFENIAIMICEQPDLVEEIVEDFCQCVERTIVRALKDVQFDYAYGWEDICFNSGPIVGVPFFRDVVTPRYKRITNLLRLHGVDIVNTDCDGNLTHIVPFFLEGGINTMFPVEVHGGTDPVALRAKYGRELRFWGGVDKMIFLRDKAAVDRELQRLRPVVEQGGFIPTVDHRVQADAKLDLYKHYLDRKREWFNVGGPEPKY